MLTTISHSAVFVTDQDEALEFYVGKLGFAVSADVDLGFMRWLTVSPPGDADRHLLLEVPGPPSMDDASAQQIRELLAKGALGLAFVLETDDCRASFEALKAKGVEFTQEPTEHFYGIDSGFRDPFGNHIRLTQPAEVMGEPDPQEFVRNG